MWRGRVLWLTFAITNPAAGAIAPELPTSLHLQTLNAETALFPGLLEYKNNQLQGQYRNLLDCVGQSLGISMVYLGKPFSRVQRDLRTNKIDGFFPANITTRRSLYAVPSAPLIADRKILIQSLKFQQAENHADNLESHIGVMRGAEFEQSLAKKLNHSLTVVGSYDQLIKMLNTGHIGAIVASEMFINSALTKTPLTLKTTRTELQSAPMHLYFNKTLLDAYPRLLPRFNQALSGCDHFAKPNKA